MNLSLLTPKDCMYLDDLMSQTFTFIKRLEEEETLLTTSTLKNTHKQVIKETKQLYEEMLAIIKEVN